MVCIGCGIVGANARPNWTDRQERPSLTGARWRLGGSPMIDRAEKDDRQARADADKGGRPLPIDGPRAALIAVGVFILLDVFAAITLPDRDIAFWPIVILTGLVAGGAYLIARLQERAWRKRYRQASDLIRAERERRARDRE
jgi:hypothetical protein